MKSKYTYLARLETDNESGGYTVEFPDLLGCISHVESVNERTEKHLQDLMKLYLKDVLNDGEQPPQARYQLTSCIPTGVLEMMVTAEVVHRRPKK